MSNVIIFILGLIGGILLLLPFIGLVVDLGKSKRFESFFGVLGIAVLVFICLHLMPDISSATVFAFVLTPVIFIYLFILKKLGNKPPKDEDILDD